MSRWTCPSCGLTVKVDDAEFPFQCPRCGFVASDRTAKPQPPGLARQAGNFARSVVVGVRAQAFRVSPKLVAQRLAICQACPLFDSAGQTCTHPDCGCRVRKAGLLNKLAWSHERCPIGRWEAVDARNRVNQESP